MAEEEPENGGEERSFADPVRDDRGDGQQFLAVFAELGAVLGGFAVAILILLVGALPQTASPTTSQDLEISAFLLAAILLIDSAMVSGNALAPWNDHDPSSGVHRFNLGVLVLALAILLVVVDRHLIVAIVASALMLLYAGYAILRRALMPRLRGTIAERRRPDR